MVNSFFFSCTVSLAICLSGPLNISVEQILKILIMILELRDTAEFCSSLNSLEELYTYSMKLVK